MWTLVGSLMAHWLLTAQECSIGEHEWCNGLRPAWGAEYNNDLDARVCRCECHGKQIGKILAQVEVN